MATIDKFKKQFNDMISYAEGLEKQLVYVKTGLENILKEEDIISLPSYKLLSNMYKPYLSSPKVKLDIVENKVFDPIYAPPSVRKSTVTLKQKKQKTQEIEPEKKKEPVVDSANIDLTKNLLIDDIPPKKKTKTIIPVKIGIVEAKGTVYKIEIKGITYFNNGIYLYDSTTNIRVGSINANGFIINGKSIPITKTIKVKSFNENIFSAKDPDGETAYVKVNDSICHAVGKIEDGEFAPWNDA